ncbi:polysaccharide biosynthesis protein [Nitrosococcus halophilus Nc 4]|uniref:Polysaccharide biosynthesis protein n=1 Tax=Nitrosococcus halophilus (strain Nc4) TaxID=472759 RepID=D5C0P3_NITHN|nr:oligosaccharide flippase family protein [Nitrosococcus halophilus]ADE16366.1 polysaccharide biosynthesis protein [Nitrosococcus halophilus Nc 4]
MNAENSFKRVVRGGVLFSIGTLLAKLLHLATGIIIIRFLSPEEYGLVSLGFTSVALLALFSILGLGTGIPQFIARHHGKKNNELVGAVAGTSLFISLWISLSCATFLYFCAPYLADYFQKPGLKQVLEIFSLMIPATVLVEVFTAIFRGIENPKAKVLFTDIGANLIRMLLLVPIIFLSLEFKWILWAYVGSIWVVLSLYLLYMSYNFISRFRLVVSGVLSLQLLSFSMPLLGTSLMSNLMGWGGTLTLGYLASAEEVAFFNAPLRLVSIIPIPLAALVFLYLPIATKIVEGKSLGDRNTLELLYIATTKWAFIVTLPLLLYFLTDAEFIVGYLFGEKYHDTANVLRVLTIGFAIHSLLGPNGMTLISYGNTRIVFIATILGAISIMTLCLVLVPYYGALGAALGTAAARLVTNIFVSFYLYKLFGIHPFRAEYVKPVIFTIFASILCVMILKLSYVIMNELLHLLLFFLIGLLALLSPIVTRSMSSNDLEILRSVENRLWGKTHIVNRISVWSCQKDTSILKASLKSGSD